MHLLQKGNVNYYFNIRIFKSIKLWHLYADLSESLKGVELARKVYEQVLDLSIATPLTILSFANMLRENKYFEDSFRAYERGVAMFKFPYSIDIWLAYIKDFIARYGGGKVERLRDIYEQAIDSASEEYKHLFYFLYAKSEEEFGKARRAMSILDRATRNVSNEQKRNIYTLYIKRATEYITQKKLIIGYLVLQKRDEYLKRP